MSRSVCSLASPHRPKPTEELPGLGRERRSLPRAHRSLRLSLFGAPRGGRGRLPRSCWLPKTQTPP